MQHLLPRRLRLIDEDVRRALAARDFDLGDASRRPCSRLAVGLRRLVLDAAIPEYGRSSSKDAASAWEPASDLTAFEALLEETTADARRRGGDDKSSLMLLAALQCSLALDRAADSDAEAGRRLGGAQTTADVDGDRPRAAKLASLSADIRNRWTRIGSDLAKLVSDLAPAADVDRAELVTRLSEARRAAPNFGSLVATTHALLALGVSSGDLLAVDPGTDPT